MNVIEKKTEEKCQKRYKKCFNTFSLKFGAETEKKSQLQSVRKKKSSKSAHIRHMLRGKEISDRAETLHDYRQQQGQTFGEGFISKTQKLTTQGQFPEFPVCFFWFP